MKKSILLFFLFSISSFSGFAQSGRTAVSAVIQDETGGLKSLSAEQLYQKAQSYANEKFNELAAKNKPYNEGLRQQILAEQRQLAAKLASELRSRPSISGVDLYFLGLLDWIAVNVNDSAASFEKFLGTKSGSAKQQQTARSVIVVISGNNGDYPKAEGMLADYYANQPQLDSEITKMEKQLAHTYHKNGKLSLAAPHADKNFEVTKKMAITEANRNAVLNQLRDAGLTAHEINRDLGALKRAEDSLLGLMDKAIEYQAQTVYANAIDEYLQFLIATNRKPEMKTYFKKVFDQIGTNFKTDSQRLYVKQVLRKREPHYLLMGEKAPELVGVEKWVDGSPSSLQNLQGKVVLLDFWATWCGPCISAFPALSKWQKDYRDQGFEVIGVTRFYGEAEGELLEKPAEIDYLEKFKKEHNLPYPFAVAYGQANQITYGATGIPTAVLIDRKGVVRFIEIGSNEARIDEIHGMIKKLLAEK